MMHCCEVQFQLLTIGFYIPTMNLITFMTSKFCGDIEKGCPPLKFIMVLDLKIMYMVQ